MRYYEILYIINPNFEKKKIDSAMKDINDRLKKTNSNIINHTIWGKKRLAYSMQGHKYGTYILLHYEGSDSEKLDEFYSWLKLSTLVVRHMVVRLNSKPELIKNKTEEESFGDSASEEGSSEEGSSEEGSSEEGSSEDSASEEGSSEGSASEEESFGDSSSKEESSKDSASEEESFEEKNREES